MKSLKLSILLILMWQLAYSQNNDYLMDLIDNNQFAEFQASVDTLDDLNIELKRGYTLLCYSLTTRSFEFANYLIDAGADIEQVCRNKSPLMYSCKSEKGFETFKKIIDKGADVNRVVNGRNAIQYALLRGNLQAVTFLEENGATTAIGFSSKDGPYLLFNPLEENYNLIRVDSGYQLMLETLSEKPDYLVVDFPNKNGVKVNLRAIENEDISEYPMPERLFAISDIEGNYEKFYESLLGNNIIDNNLTWTFGSGHLVLVGDFVDRGENVAAVLWLIYKLEQEAIAAGGKVHLVLGNHEVMSMQGYNGYAAVKYHLLALRTHNKVSDFYSENAELGNWLRSKNVIEKIGDHLFVHGGISDSLLATRIPITDINTIARKNFNTPESDNLSELILNSEYGVLWYRGLIMNRRNYNKASEEVVDEILSYYAVDDIVIGHCIVDDISTDYNGKVIRIDLEHYETSSAGVLFENDKIFKVTIQGEKTLLH